MLLPCSHAPSPLPRATVSKSRYGSLSVGMDRTLADFCSKSFDNIDDVFVDVMKTSDFSTFAEFNAGQGRSIADKFRNEMCAAGSGLVPMLTACDGHFIRCIKPNDRRKAFTWDDSKGLVLEQLRSCGVLEAAKVAQAGFAQNYLFGEFVRKFHVDLRGEHTIREFKADFANVQGADPLEHRALLQQMLEKHGIGASEPVEVRVAQLELAPPPACAEPNHTLTAISNPNPNPNPIPEPSLHGLQKSMP